MATVGFNPVLVDLGFLFLGFRLTELLLKSLKIERRFLLFLFLLDIGKVEVISGTCCRCSGAGSFLLRANETKAGTARVMKQTKSRGISFLAFFFFFTSPNIALKSSSNSPLCCFAICSWAVVGPMSTASPFVVRLSITSGAGWVGSASGPRGSSEKATCFFFGFFLNEESKSGSSDMFYRRMMCLTQL